MYKLLSDVGLSSLSVGTFGMISSMITNQDPAMTILSTGFLTGGLACKIGSSFLQIREEYNSIESEESIWNNSMLYYLAIERNRLLRMESIIIYRRTNYTRKQKEQLIKDLLIEKELLNKKEETLKTNKLSIDEKLDHITKLENMHIPSNLYIRLKEDVFEEDNVVSLEVNGNNSIKNNNGTKAKIYKFPKNKDK